MAINQFANTSVKSKGWEYEGDKISILLMCNVQCYTYQLLLDIPPAIQTFVSVNGKIMAYGYRATGWFIIWKKNTSLIRNFELGDSFDIRKVSAEP